MTLEIKTAAELIALAGGAGGAWLRRQAVSICVETLVIAFGLLAVTVIAQAAEPRNAEVLLQYQKSQSRIMPQFTKTHGKYLGSGTGTVDGAINGKVIWDLHEDQDATQLHRTQFVGRITSTDGSSIDFETAGYFVPRRGAPDFWDLTSAVYFFSANGPAFQSLQGALGVWEGDVDTRTFRHRYRLRLLENIGKPE